jgi:trans-AT polyketide synthase/acyltransferase/oxidoreductase domain-containing protein
MRDVVVPLRDPVVGATGVRHHAEALDAMNQTDSQLIFMFSGQGSHYPGMGKALYEHNPVFRHWMHRLDETARDELGHSVVGRLYGATRELGAFDQTALTHPGIFMVEYALARTLMDAGIKPDLALGSSLGEVAACALAGIFEADDCLRFVIRQALLFDRLCPPGGMMAVVHSPDIHARHRPRSGGCEIAGIGSPQSFVVSGSHAALAEYQSFLQERGIATSRLAVSRAFHSSLVEPARAEFLAASRQLKPAKPRMPVVSCARADFLDQLLPDHFWDVVRRPVNGRDTFRKLASAGRYVYLDVGPSGTMANMMKYNCEREPPPKSFYVLDPYGDELGRLQSVVSDIGLTSSPGNERRPQKSAYLFPGQGAQYKGMGGGLFDEFPDLTAKADAVLGYSIKELCTDDPRRMLNQTDHTQPAIYVVSALSYLKRLGEGGQPPDYLAGHSLGEYTALFAAGVFDFETGLRLVQRRGALMSATSSGGMAAILELDRHGVATVIAENALSEIDIANLNAPRQTVIAGPLAALNAAQIHFEKAGGVFVPLNVSAPFHSRYMRPAATEFAEFLERFEFRRPKIPVIANTTAKPYGPASAGIKANLANQIVSSVRWFETVWYLMHCGVDGSFKEIGPGGTLTKLWATIRGDGVPGDFTVENSAPPTGPQLAKTAVEDGARAPIAAAQLGSRSFKSDYGINYAYVAGAMYMAIASEELVIRLGKAGYLGFFGTGGLDLPRIESGIRKIKQQLSEGQPYGMNLLCNTADPAFELETVLLFLDHGIRCIEASAFIQITPALVLYRLSGLSALPSGEIASRHRILAKVSRPEVASAFLAPSPAELVDRLLLEGRITRLQAELGRRVPVATDLCVEADSGGHTDRGIMATLLPTIIRLKDRLCAQFGYRGAVHVGAAGGIGTPEAAAAAFLLGADFILTGSVNQCTCEAGTSDIVKDLLEKIDVHDTDYAPAGDMFEMGSKVQVMKRGVFFAARANKLYELWKNHDSIEQIGAKDRSLLQERYFRRSFDEIYRDVRKYCEDKDPAGLAKLEASGKHKMALIFRTYFADGTRAALNGDESNRVNFQVQCGPALGAFNQWVRGTSIESWRHRHVDQIAARIIEGAAAVLNDRFEQLTAAAKT